MAARMRRGRFARLRQPESLGARLVLILTAVGVAGAIGITVLLVGIITPSFNRLETTSVAAHVGRTNAALGEYAAKVESAVRDYGDWTDSYEYVATPTEAFERESFSPLAMQNLDVDGMAYVGNDRRILIARWRGSRANDWREAIGRMDLARTLGTRSSASFYTRLGDVVAAVGVAQVRRSDGTGAPRGHVLMARRITSRQLSALLSLDARIDLSRAPQMESQTLSRMAIAVPIVGADGRPVARARFVVPRDVSVLGRRMLLLAVAGSTLLLLIVLMVLRRVITRLVLKPLNRVETHMQKVRASGSLGLLDEEERRADEIGSLGRSFNAMLRQLKDLREQLEVQSFALGRSESAVAVMHNVRNALNPISTIISQGIAQAPPIDRQMLDRAAGELARDDLPAVRRQKLAAFVAAAVNALEAARTEQQQQLGIGRTAMAHVLDIIGQQQANAHERPPLSECDVTEIIAQNATIARYSGETSIAFSFPAHPWPVLANRVILSQVIGNLFANATEAIAGAGRTSGAITVTVDHAEGQAIVRIRDDGEGFEREVGATLFQRGYSTRQHKSGGLGLHWCANSMNAMEGSLRLESEGRGRGAVAVLTLKVSVAAEVAQAA